MIKQVE